MTPDEFGVAKTEEWMQGPVPSASVPSPAWAPPPLPPPPRRGTPTWVGVLVIVVIAVVILGIVTLAVLYGFVTGFSGPAPSKPVVVFAPPETITRGFSVEVAGATPSKATANYQVNLQEGPNMAAAQSLTASITFTIGSNSYTVAYADIGGEGALSAGDNFRVIRTTGLVADTEYRLRLVWSDGSQIASVTYTQGPSKPQVTVSSSSAITNGFQFTIATASPAKPTANFVVNFNVDATPGIPVALGPSMSFTVNGYMYTVTYTDVGGEGALTAGDIFAATKTYPVGPLAPGVTYHVTLLWSDGSQVVDAPYASPGYPQVIVAVPTGITNGFQFSVAAASQAKAISNYGVNFVVDTAPGIPIALGPSMTFTVGGNTYTVTYTDIGGEGALTAGDFFTATKTSPAGPLTPAVTYHVLILWWDGFQIADASFMA